MNGFYASENGNSRCQMYSGFRILKYFLTITLKRRFILQKWYSATWLDLEQLFESQLFDSIVEHLGSYGRVDFVERVH